MIGQRIKARLDEIGMSEAELARRVGIRQSTINALVLGRSRSSRHLHEIARELDTTTAYLKEETEDPVPLPAARAEDRRSEYRAEPPRRSDFQVVQMGVMLPSVAALARMFEGLLRPTDVEKGMPAAELARILARRLPTGLAQLRDLVPPPEPGEAPEGDGDPPARATDRRGSPRAPRT